MALLVAGVSEGVENGASGAQGETPEYLALPLHAGLWGGGPFTSLATRGKIEIEEKPANLTVQRRVLHST